MINIKVAACQKGAKMMMLDTQTFDGAFRLTSFCDTAENVMTEFFYWMQEDDISPKDIWYADVFEFEPDEGANPVRIAVIKPQSGAQAEIIAKPDGKSPFRKRIPPISGLARRLVLIAKNSQQYCRIVPVRIFSNWNDSFY